MGRRHARRCSSGCPRRCNGSVTPLPRRIGDDFVEADRAYHDVTLEESGNVILSGFYSSLRDRQMRMTGESLIHDRQRMATILDEHRGIAEALRDGDLQRTLEAVQTHLAGTLRSLGLAVEPRFGGGA